VTLRRKLLVIALPIVVLVATVGLVLVYYTKRGDALPAGDSFWGYRFSRTTYGDNIAFLEYLGENEKLNVTEVTGIDQSVADALIVQKVAVFRALFEKQRVGYRGQHTEYIECPDSFKPKFFEKAVDGGHLRYFVGFANERFSAGACSEEDIKYSAVNAFLYCADYTTMFEIDHFRSLDSGSARAPLVDTIDCKY